VTADIDCDGCLAAGERLFKFCRDCEVRACALTREVSNCAHCPDFACSRLEKIWQMTNSAEARERLKGIRKGLEK
jgi:hypothetical protein